MLPILALGTNAAVGEPAIEVGFENTPCVRERDYFQSYVPPEADIVYITRHVNVEATVALIRALGTHSDSERLRRGANQYQLALSYWRLGLETLALAHLWMALEAITKARLGEECSKRGLNAPGQLAESLGVPLEQLDGVVRKDLILKGDEECYKKASEASNALEHGYLDYREIIDLSKDVRHRMAKYVRTAILDMCVLDKGIYNILVNKPFDTPLGHWPIVKYFRGKLVGAGETLAAEGNAYPFLRWKPIIKSTKFDSDGKLNIQFTESLTPELAKGISFQPKSLEAWRAE